MATVIEDYAFHGCKKLTKIHIPGSVKTIGNSNFFGCNESMTIHTPRGSYAEAYAKENYIAVTHEAPPMIIFLEPKPQNEDKNVSEETPVSLANDIATKTINENACYITNNIVSADNNRAGAVAGQAEQNNSEHVRQVKLNAQRSRYDELSTNIVLQMQIISQNKALFGIKAKTRKAAQQQLAALQAQLTKEFPNGKP